MVGGPTSQPIPGGTPHLPLGPIPPKTTEEGEGLTLEETPPPPAQAKPGEPALDLDETPASRIHTKDYKRENTALAKLIRDMSQDHCGAPPTKVHFRYPREGGGFITPPPKPGDKIAWNTLKDNAGITRLKTDIEVEIEVGVGSNAKKVRFTYPLGARVEFPLGSAKKQQEACQKAYNATLVYCKGLKKTFKQSEKNEELINNLATQKTLGVLVLYTGDVPRRKYDVRQTKLSERVRHALAPETGVAKGGVLFYKGHKTFWSGESRHIDINFKEKKTTHIQRWTQQHTINAKDEGFQHINAAIQAADRQLEGPRPKRTSEEFSTYMEKMKATTSPEVAQKITQSLTTDKVKIPVEDYVEGAISDAEGALSNTGNLYTTSKDTEDISPFTAFTKNAGSLNQLYREINANNKGISAKKKELEKEVEKERNKKKSELMRELADIELELDLRSTDAVQRPSSKETAELQWKWDEKKKELAAIDNKEIQTENTMMLQLDIARMTNQNKKALTRQNEETPTLFEKLIEEDSKLFVTDPGNPAAPPPAQVATQRANAAYALLHSQLPLTDKQKDELEKRLETVNKTSDELLKKRVERFNKAKKEVESRFAEAKAEFEKITKPKETPFTGLEETGKKEEIDAELEDRLLGLFTLFQGPGDRTLAEGELGEIQKFCEKYTIDVSLPPNISNIKDVREKIAVSLLENCEGDISGLTQSQARILKKLGKELTVIPNSFDDLLTLQTIKDVFPNLTHLNLEKIKDPQKEEILSFVNNKPPSLMSINISNLSSQGFSDEEINQIKSKFHIIE